MDASTRTFGVEIETHIPLEHAPSFPVGSYHVGTQIPHYPEGWTGQSDSTIGCQGWHSVEIVSPVLRGEAGLTQVTYVVNNLHELGATADASCGLHVHIGVEDLTLSQIKAVKRAFLRYERAFSALSGEDAQTRVNSRYAKNSDQWTSDSDRYQSLNLTNTLRARLNGNHSKNTIEFRMWASTTVDTTVIAAISMAMALIQKVADFGAATQPRIDDEKESVKAFVTNHFRVAANYRIVQDAPIGDVILHTWHEARKASH